MQITKANLLALASLMLMGIPVSAQSNVNYWFDEQASRPDGINSVADATVKAEPLCNCEPLWSFELGVTGLKRTRPDIAALTINTAAPGERLFSNQFKFDSKAGVEATLRRRINNTDIEFEVRYFGVDEMNEIIVTPYTAGTLDFNYFFQNTTVATSVISSYSTELHNIELNLINRSNTDRAVTFLAGYRALELNEFLSHQINSPTGTGGSVLYFDGTKNRLHGVQVGAATEFFNTGLTSLDISFKLGIFGNSAKRTAAVFNSATAPASPLTARAGQTAMVGEFGLGLNIHIWDNLNLRLRYNVVFIDGVALSAEQTTFNVNNTMQTSGDAVYKGGFIGLDYAY